MMVFTRSGKPGNNNAYKQFLQYTLLRLIIADSIYHLGVHYVGYVMFVQRFEPQDRRFTNVHYYYDYDCVTEK